MEGGQVLLVLIFRSELVTVGALARSADMGIWKFSVSGLSWEKNKVKNFRQRRSERHGNVTVVGNPLVFPYSQDLNPVNVVWHHVCDTADLDVSRYRF